MTCQLAATEVFTPGDYPTRTYVKRDEDRLERKLEDALNTAGQIVSLSGPSKSGKTVLVERVVGDDLITITGAGVRSPADVWNRVLDWMGLPAESTSSAATSGSGTLGTKTKGGASVFGLGKVEVEGSADLTSGHSKSEAERHTRRGLAQVAYEIAESSFVVLIDDFHYMDRQVQVEVAKELKEAARLGVKLCTASVPHRSDDVVRSNPELRGRVKALDIGYWSVHELKKIATLGFPLLNLSLDDEWISRLTSESSGSPQLMQMLCLYTCFALNAREARSEVLSHTVTDDEREMIFEEAATSADFGTLVTTLHRGPRTRGVERKEFDLTDGSKGDNYRCVLRAIASDPPRLHFPPDEMSRRVAAACSGADSPQNAAIRQACSQMAKLAADHPAERVLDWDDVDDLLDIVDPYFLFYLRASRKLSNLALSNP